MDYKERLKLLLVTNKKLTYTYLYLKENILNISNL